MGVGSSPKITDVEAAGDHNRQAQLRLPLSCTERLCTRWTSGSLDYLAVSTVIFKALYWNMTSGTGKPFRLCLKHGGPYISSYRPLYAVGLEGLHTHFTGCQWLISLFHLPQTLEIKGRGAWHGLKFRPGLGTSLCLTYTCALRLASN